MPDEFVETSSMPDEFNETSSMPDEFVETTSQSWFGRIGDSITGIIFGIILLPISMILLSWNEGRALTTARSLKEAAAAVVSVEADSILPANEKKLVHLSGEVRAGETIRDPVFGLTAEALRVKRMVKMYQWEEKKSSKSRNKLGGGKETVTKYTYAKAWSDNWVDSGKFKHPQGHLNPASMPVSAGATLSSKATLGAYKVPTQFIAKMAGGEPLMPTAESIANLPKGLKEKAQLNGERIYIGADPATPEIGDALVTFDVLKPGIFSILAQQNGGSLAPYPTKAGRAIERVESGMMGAALMFQQAEDENRLLTWGLRLGGFLLMSTGFAMVLNPLRVLADIVPVVGDIVGIGAGAISGVLAFAGSLVVVAIAWLAVRPLLAWVLIVSAGGAVVYGVVCMRKGRTKMAISGAP